MDWILSVLVVAPLKASFQSPHAWAFVYGAVLLLAAGLAAVLLPAAGLDPLLPDAMIPIKINAAIAPIVICAARGSRLNLLIMMIPPWSVFPAPLTREPPSWHGSSRPPKILTRQAF